MQPALTILPGRTPVSPRTGLTLKQEAFALGLANGMSQLAAYRAAYSVVGRSDSISAAPSAAKGRRMAMMSGAPDRSAATMRALAASSSLPLPA